MSAAIPTQRRRDARCDTWPRVRLGEVCVSLTSQIRQRDLDGNTGPYPIFGAAGFLRNSCFCMVDKPAIAMVKDGAGVGRAMCIPANSAVIGTMLILKPNNGIDRGYLFYALSSLNLGRLCSGATIPHLYFRDMKALTVLLPPLAIQRRIAAKLDRLCDIVTKRKNQLSQLNQLVKSRFVEMFGDPMTNPKRWPMARLGDRCLITTGNTPSRNEKENYGDFIEWIKSDNLVDGRLTTASEYLSEIGYGKSRHVGPGSILMTCIAGSLNSIGNSALVDRNVTFNQQLNAITPYKDDVVFLLWLLQLAKPVLHKGINICLKGILSKSNLPGKVLPLPPLALQREFAAFVEKVDKLAFAARRRRDVARQLYRAKIQEFFG